MRDPNITVRQFTVDFLCNAEIGLDVHADNHDDGEGYEEVAEALFNLETEISEQMNDRNQWWAQDTIDIALTEDDWILFDWSLGRSETRRYPIRELRQIWKQLEPQRDNDEADMASYSIVSRVNQAETHMVNTTPDTEISVSLPSTEWTIIDALPGVKS